MFHVGAHRIYSFNTYPIGFDKPLEDRRMRELVVDTLSIDPGTTEDFERQMPTPVQTWVPERLIPGVLDHYCDEPIFEETVKPQGSDLYLPAHRLVSGELPERCRVYRLSQRMLDLFNKGDLYHATKPEKRFGHRLALILPRLATVRAQSGETKGASYMVTETKTPKTPKGCLIVPIRIVELVVYHFATDRVVCQLALEAMPVNGVQPSSALLTEIAAQCGRFPKLAWQEITPSILRSKSDSSVGQLISMPEFTIGTLLARLLSGSHGHAQRTFRTYTYTFMQVDDGDSETSKQGLVDFGARLARHYTGDYALSSDAKNVETVSDFDNVVHVLAREGAATVIDPRTNSQTVSFLKDYVSVALEASYLPILVLNLHQLAEMLELNARSILTTKDPVILHSAEGVAGEDELIIDGIVDSWSRLQDKLALLNARYRFHQISQISMHNQLNRALRGCFQLDEMERHLDNDLKQMSSQIQTALAIRSRDLRRKFENRYKFIPALAGAFGVGILGMELFNTLFAASEEGFSFYEKLGLGLIGVAMIVGAWFTNKRLKNTS